MPVEDLAVRIEALLVTSDLRCSRNAAGHPFREGGSAISRPPAGDAASRPEPCLARPRAAGLNRSMSAGVERASSKAVVPAHAPSPTRIANLFDGGCNGHVSSKAFGLTCPTPPVEWCGIFGRPEQVRACCRLSTGPT